MSAIVHPVHSLQTKCRPKHQVLVLKCYPNIKYVKSQTELKPNSSELSYLLYYASTRRSKLQKVGAFLEKKTASDVWRVKLGNVQVTLQILTALMEKSPRDLPLYSRYILSILDSVLRSNDINMIEESITTFETFCKYVQYSSLAADQALANQYLSIMQTYANFASDQFLTNPKIAKFSPLVFRWRTASLKAIRSVVGSDAVLADSAKQLEVVMPVILDNLYLEEDDILAILQQKAQTSEKLDFEIARKRRMSIATVSTVDTTEADPATASGTTADADKLAKDEVRVLAVRCLKQIFAAGTSSHRGQIRLATALTLRFIASRSPPQTSAAPFRPGLPGARNGNWATSLVEAIARWTPVQDRFIILITAMETLVRSPIVESVLDKQLVLATMIDWLLNSTVNFIGLSVMDVLLGLIQHTLLLLQLGGRNSRVAPHYQQSNALDLFRDTKETFTPGVEFMEPSRGREQSSKETTPSPVRQELLVRLQKCIGDLATHIYYTDQITDMMTAILARLKPSQHADISSMAAAIEDPSATARAIAASISLQEDPTTDGFFSFATARVTALRAVKDILVISNFRKTSSGSGAEARSRVGIQVWEGTQWLLRDEDREVRTAYVDALLTWLKLETNKNDLHLPKEGRLKTKSAKKAKEGGPDASLAKRAVSNTSKREPKPAKTTFLQLLHLAIYDNAVESPETESDVLLLHLLLSNLVERLGVNAVRTGLPMILRLQEAALNDDSVSAQAKVNAASLVHGYLWTLCEKFDFEVSRVGNEINAEVSRRKRFSVWFDMIRFPAIATDHIPAPDTNEKRSAISEEAVGTMKPFLNNTELVDEIAKAYDGSLLTPANSPPSSPGRVFSVPTLGFGYGYGLAPGPRPSPEDQLPAKVRDEMLAGWSRDACIAAVEKESSKTASVTGSRAATSGRQHLGVNGMPNGNASGRESPSVPPPDGVNQSFGAAGGLSALHKLQRLNTNDGSPVPLSGSSSRDSTMRVADLKQALLGQQPSLRQASPLRRPISKRGESYRSDGTESMVAYTDPDGPDSPVDGAGRLSSIAEPETLRPRTAPNGETSTPRQQDGAADGPPLPRDMSDPRMGDDVPPVPRIPSSLNLPGTYPPDASPDREEGMKSPHPNTNTVIPNRPRTAKGYNNSPESAREGRTMMRGNSRPTSRKGPAGIGGDDTFAPGEKLDLDSLLAGIQTSGKSVGHEEEIIGTRKGKERGNAPLSAISRPPY